MTPAQAALQKRTKFNKVLTKYGQTVVRKREGGAIVGTTDSSRSYKCLVATLPQYPTTSYQDVGGLNLGADDNHKILYFPHDADITEKDTLVFNGRKYNTTLVFPFVLSDVPIYLEVKISRHG